MPILLGLDTGGTYTDAVLFDQAQGMSGPGISTAADAAHIHGGVLATAKSLTTKHDLSIGLKGAIEAVLPRLPEGVRPADIALVSMSTTLATNAIVEGHGAPICLILLGYDVKSLERAGLKQALGTDPVVFAAGGHKPTGDEQAPLDVATVKAAILEHAPKVAAFAVSGYFSVRNPAHEIAVRQMIRDLTDKPVSCGHELTSKLDAPRRALTVALNARLIPQLQQLIRAVGTLLTEKGISAPLMVVKGDGSLIDQQVALTCPVETILSGPAASLVGARHLSGAESVMVSDMGGTTTDIAMLRDGRPVLNKEGAVVGGWRTMVEAVAVHTYGLGGDSEVRIDEHHGFLVGPRRVVALSLLAHLYPTVLDKLRAQYASEDMMAYRGQFALRQRPLDTGAEGLSEGQMKVWEALADGPVALADLIFSPAIGRHLARLVDRGLVIISGLTPSDAAHVLGRQSSWCTEAAEIGAELFLRRAPFAGWVPPENGRALAEAIVEQVVLQSGRVILETSIAEQAGIDHHHWGTLGRYLVDRSLAPSQADSALVDVALKLNFPLVAIGAPVGSYYGEIARRLRTELIIPPHADVSNAVGAVAGGVMQKVAITITQPIDGVFRAHLPGGLKDFTDLETAAAFARDTAEAEAAAMAKKAGASDIELSHERADKVFEQPGGLKIFMESLVSVTAFGRPALAQG
ncbi:hydantoinase/oxoprolinase family protein [Dongia rigui]|uniref:Hydantoinase/oxoprolinase family protein n=1 Tax=Dongia rigui TaxID=940149 RepID=A0ABU5DVT6_9PROT|nr:hydantoinase/oxoprolinase family protein [Dongia rigui]MDY0871055.1 hydantoinase/oxoprolinase family protein [Dongia rigui]